MNHQPSPGEPDPPRKPIKGNKILIYALIGVFVVFVILQVVSTPKLSTEPRSSQQINAVAGRSQIEQFDRERAAQEEILSKQRTDLLKGMQNPGMPGLLMPLPPCDQAMRDKLAGKYYTARTVSNVDISLVCTPKDDWAIVPTGAGAIVPPTAQQEQAMYRHAPTGPNSERIKREQEREKARLEALNSSSVAMDYSKPKPLYDQSGLPVSETVSHGRRLNIDDDGDVREDLPQSAKKPKYEWNSATGPTYKIFEGSIIETILTNRLDGEFTGPVNVMVTTDLWSRDHQHVLIPQGTRILGEAVRVNASGQKRLAIVFHRAVMPDGYSVDLDKFAGLDQQGVSGASGKVNTHWPKLIATAALVGAIGGIAEAGAIGSTYSGLGAIRTGVGEQTGQEATQILNRALNQMPTITVYEGTRIRVWVKSDVDLPAFENHNISPTL